MSRLTTMRVLWAAIFGSTLMFLMVGFVLTNQRQAVPEPDFVLLPVLALSAVAMAGMSLMLPRHVLRRSLRALALPTQELPRQELMFRDGKQRPRKFADPAEARARLMVPAQTSFILGLALAEAVALHGFLLWFIGFGLEIALAFFALSWLLMLTKLPKLGAYERELEAVYDADLG